ncbi:glycosyltransferase family 9 protein [Puia dinghuensis]|uniref:Glycosyltransferase family 9 protein n=1 Tax=Puia dinghuensis TaxID=1792502 RepID=A0A8J2UHM1_9BACT|nr:glycosyltransferase family 9 protein [Puia dinghuensis]GGB18858.1 hypothetical protein GCM10011511_48320 [Puia dinghuensis]
MNIPARKWNKDVLPRRILAIRLQAMGDLVITLPYLQHLRNSLPAGTRLDLLTREEVNAIPKEIELFDKVYTIRGGRNTKKQLIYTALLLPELWARRYGIVIDLQNNIISRLVRNSLLPRAWSEFDRFSPVPAGESTRLTIEAVGLGKCDISSRFKIRHKDAGRDLLIAHGWDGNKELIVLNPAGAFPTRNWAMDKYVEFARLWLQRRPASQFLLLGTSFIAAKSTFLKNALGGHLINLTGKTTPAQAFTVLQQTSLVLSEDSGLMHMSWVSGIPTLAIFGSTRDRARPLGPHALLLNSSDLPCGNCMLEECKYGDTHCLSRYTADMVFDKALSLLQKAKENP